MTETNNENLVSEARKLSGEDSGGTRLPFIPMIRVNNKDEEREQEIDGQIRKVKIPPQKGFIVKEKDQETGETKESLWKELNATILKERYKIQSKFNHKPEYFSPEFDNWLENIPVLDAGSKELMFEGTYPQLKEHFFSGEYTSIGSPKKTFNLQLVLYIDVNGAIYKFNTPVSGKLNWFDYKNTFSFSETYLGYKTKFELDYIESGSVDYWQVRFERGESVDLKKSIEMAKEIDNLLGGIAQKEIAKPAQEETKQIKQSQEKETQSDDNKNSNDITLNDIPF